MSDLDLVGLLGGVLPQGAGPAGDPSIMTTGVVESVVDGVTVRVRVAGSSLVLPAQPGPYTAGVPVLVLRDPAASRPVLVLCVTSAVSAAPRFVRCPITGVSGDTVTITWTDGTSRALPALPSTYSTSVRAWVAVDAFGAPQLILGPSSLPAPDQPAPPPPPPGQQTQQVTVMIGPQWSGTWRSIRSAWDRWNVDRYGGRASLYQGSLPSAGSGPLTGLAVYGGQFQALGAISIDAVTIKALLATGGGTPVFQGSPQGSAPGGAPASSGPTFGTSVPANVREQLRTGAVKGLALVGGSYLALYGAGSAQGGMTCQVTYTRYV